MTAYGLVISGPQETAIPTMNTMNRQPGVCRGIVLTDTFPCRQSKDSFNVKESQSGTGMIKIDWDKFFEEYVIFGWYRFYTVSSNSEQPRYTWSHYGFDLHKEPPWHKCYKVQ